MIPHKGKSYIAAKTISPLLAGEDLCKWKVWVKAHFKYKKTEGDGDGSFLKEWIRKHDAMTASRAERLLVEGYNVFIEDKNSFKLEGERTILAGKPDIIATKPEVMHAVVIDEKSGKKKAQHWWQVATYMFALKFGRLKDYKIHGEIEYEDQVVSISPEDVGTEQTKQILDMIKLVGGSAQPATTPGKWECKYCDILQCPDRYDDTEDVTKVGVF